MNKQQGLSEFYSFVGVAKLYILHLRKYIYKKMLIVNTDQQRKKIIF